MKTRQEQPSAARDEGRWHATKGLVGGWVIIADEITGKTVAVAYDEKDAPLLAASPELLAALKSAVESLEDARETILDIDPDEWMRVKPLSERIEALQAAIAKAEGGAE